MKEKKARQEPNFFLFVKGLSALKQNGTLFFFLVVDIFRLISLPAFERVFEISDNRLLASLAGLKVAVPLSYVR